MQQLSTPLIKIQAPKSNQEIKVSKHELEDNNQKTFRLQNSIKIQNLPYDYDFWEVLDIFIKVGQISEYYQDSREMIIVFEKQDSVFLSRFFNNHQFGKHEQVLRIAQEVKERDILGKDFKQYEINHKNDSGNTSFADFEFAHISGMQFQSNAINAAPNLLSNISAKDTPNNILNISHGIINQSQAHIKSQSFIDVLNQATQFNTGGQQQQVGNPSVISNNNQLTNQNSSRFLTIPIRQSSNSPQVENKISKQSFIVNAKQQIQKESERQPNIHQYVRNNSIISKTSQHHPSNSIKVIQSGLHRGSTIIINSINNIPTQNALNSQAVFNSNPSKFGTLIDNKVDSESEETSGLAERTPFQREKKKIFDQMNTSTISSQSSNQLERTKKKTSSASGYGNDSENEDVASLQERKTVRRRITIVSNVKKQIDCSTEEGLKQIFLEVQLPSHLVSNADDDEREIFTYYVMRRKYVLFIMACYLFYWLYF